MQLSKMSTKQAAKTLVRIAMPTKRITKDEKFIALFRDLVAAAKVRDALDLINVLCEAIPLLLESHYADLVAVVATITDKPEKQIEDESVEQMIKDVKESLDGEYMRFFTTSIAQTMRESTESPSASSNTDTTE